jgi:hypothetical protein
MPRLRVHRRLGGEHRYPAGAGGAPEHTAEQQRRGTTARHTGTDGCTNRAPDADCSGSADHAGADADDRRADPAAAASADESAAADPAAAVADESATAADESATAADESATAADESAAAADESATAATAAVGRLTVVIGVFRVGGSRTTHSAGTKHSNL